MLVTKFDRAIVPRTPYLYFVDERIDDIIWATSIILLVQIRRAEFDDLGANLSRQILKPLNHLRFRKVDRVLENFFVRIVKMEDKVSTPANTIVINLVGEVNHVPLANKAGVCGRICKVDIGLGKARHYRLSGTPLIRPHSRFLAGEDDSLVG